MSLVARKLQTPLLCSSQHPSRPELSTEPPVTFLTLSQPRQELYVIKLKFGATTVVQLHTERMEYSTVI